MSIAVYRRPSSLKYISLSVMFLLPLLMLNILLIARVPLSKAKSLDLLIWVVPVILTAISFSLVWYVRPFVKQMLAILFGVILYANLFLMFYFKNYSLAFFSLGFFIYSLTLLVNLHYIIELPFLKDSRRWFEGMPTMLPRLNGLWLVNDQKFSVHLSQLSEVGIFLHLSKQEQIDYGLFRNMESQVSIQLGNQSVMIPLRLMTENGEVNGLGFEFVFKGLDHKKEVLDFIQVLRSQGYVQ